MEGQKNKKIAFVTASLNTYSETFIKAQIDLLQPEIVFHDGRLPSKMNGEPIISALGLSINRISRKLFHFDVITLQRRLVNLLKKNKIDAVLAQFGPVGVAMLNVCRKANLPLIVHFHGFDASHKLTLDKYETAYQEMFSYAKYIVVVSRVMAENLQKMGCPKNKIVLNTYGVNEIFFKVTPTQETKIFFAVGRFVEKKGPELTIQAFQRVYAQFPEAKLYMAGNGPLLENCMQLVRNMSLEKNVFFPGVLKQEMIAGFMERSLAFVQHSIVASSGDSEGTPVAIMEASAASRPVISTYHAGIPDVIQNGVTGFLVQEGDIVGMADAMMLLLKDKALARKMGLAGRERIKSEFSMERYISVLKSLLNT